MPQMGDFQAYISVNKSRLPVYGVQSNPTEKIVTFWIPATENQIFTVNWMCSKDLTWTSCGDVVVDGVSVGGMTLKPCPHGHARAKTSCTAEVGFSENPGERFRFGKCDLPIDSPDGSSGEIRLDIYLIPDLTQEEADNPAFKCLLINPSNKKSTVGARWKYQKDAPLIRIQRMATFVIKYRLEDLLQQTFNNRASSSRLSPAPENLDTDKFTFVTATRKRRIRRPDAQERRVLDAVQKVTTNVDAALLKVEIDDARKHLRLLLAKANDERAKGKLIVSPSQILSFGPQTGLNVGSTRMAREILDLAKEAREAHTRALAEERFFGPSNLKL